MTTTMHDSVAVRLTWDDGREAWDGTWADWQADNLDLQISDRLEIADCLRDRGVFVGGGGAWAEWTLMVVD